MLGCVTDLDSIGKTELPHLTHLSIKFNVRNWKRIDSDLPQFPSSRTGFDIPQSFQELQSGERFLAFDSGREEVNRMLLFVTDEGISDLNKYRNWAFDGTFNVSPTIFYQLFTIYVHIGNEVIPRSFAHLPYKTIDAYLT